MRRIEKGLTRLLEGAGLRHALGVGLALFQFGDDLGQHLGVLEEVIAHDFADGLPLRFGKRSILGHRGRPKQQDARERESRK